MTRCLPALFSIFALVAASRAVARASASGPGVAARRPCVARTTRGGAPSAPADRVAVAPGAALASTALARAPPAAFVAAGCLRAAFLVADFFAAFFVAALVDAREVATVPSSVGAAQRRFEHQVLDFVEPHPALRRRQR